MNTRILQENIRYKLRRLRSVTISIDGLVTRSIINSLASISDNAVFTANKNAVLSKIFGSTFYIPKWSFPGKKNQSVGAKTFSLTVGIYPNRSIIKPVNTTVLSRYQSPVLLVDINNKMYDVRSKGGGYTKDYIQSVVANSRHISSYTDIGYYDGLPLAASASIAVELPDDVKTKYNESYIVDIIKKFSASGMYPVIFYYHASDVEQYGWNLNGSENS